MPKTMICPFYINHEKLYLLCEAGRLNFRTAEQKTEYIEHYCASMYGYNSCTLAASLTKTYEKQT